MATYRIDPAHTSAQFSARHMMITTVRGRFENVSGTLEFDPQHPENGYVEAVLDAASLATGNTDRDNHLRSADFLDVASYPSVTFKSTNVKRTGDDTADLTGDLTIRGVTRPVTLKVEFLGLENGWNGPVAGFSATGRINREDFGLTWNVALESGGVLVGKEIKLEIDAEFIQVTEAVAEAVAGD